MSTKNNTKIVHKRGVWSESIVSKLKDGEIFYDITGEHNPVMGLEGKDEPVSLGGNAQNAYSAIQKLDDYLYEVEYQGLDYVVADKHFNSKEDTIATTYRYPACTSVRKDGFYGRNFDWYNSDLVSFVIHTPASLGHHASVGVGGSMQGLTKDVVESGKSSSLYKYLPFMIFDGINDAGVVCTDNVVENIDVVPTTGTNPGMPRLNAELIPRFVLDNFDNATDAVNEIAHNRDVFMPYKAEYSDNRMELHFIIADSSNTYILEFVGNEARVIDKSEEKEAYMTNFKLSDTSVDESGHIIPESVHPYGCGLERYNLVADQIGDVGSTDVMLNIMKSVKYTNAYNLTVEGDEGLPQWKTELTGSYTPTFSLVVTDPIEKFRPVFEIAKQRYIDGQCAGIRDSKSWYSEHTSIYDMVNKSFDVYSQENFDKKFSFKL